MGNFDNYYIDGNGKAHRDIPLGTSPADAYVRTNMKLKKEVQRIDGAMQEVSEHIDAEISRLDEAIVNTTDSASRQLESAVNNINQNIDEISEDFDTKINSEIAVVNTRIDNIISAVTTDTEVTDIRVGADRITYRTAGEAVREQFLKINNAIETTYSTNRWDPAKATENAVLDFSGNCVSGNSIVSDFIAVNAGDTLHFTAIGTNQQFLDEANRGGIEIVCCYNANKEFIQLYHWQRAMTIPDDGTAYVRLSIASYSSLATISITLNSVPTAIDEVTEFFENVSAVDSTARTTANSALSICTNNDRQLLSCQTALTGLDDTVKNIVENIHSANRWNPAEATKNAVLNSSGNCVSGNSIVSDFIAVNAGDTLHFTAIGTNQQFLDEANRGGIEIVCCYNANKEFIQLYHWQRAMTIPDDGTAYVRLSIASYSSLATISITLNSVPTAIDEVTEFFENVSAVDSTARTTANSALSRSYPNNIEIIVPPVVPYVPGHEINVYYENLVKGADLSAIPAFWIERPSITGWTSLQDRLIITDNTARTINRRLFWRDFTDQYYHNVAFVGNTPKDSGSISMITIGDSKVAAGVITDTLQELFEADHVTLNQLGTAGGSVSHPTRHEGRSGWSTYEYCNNETFHEVANPFYNPAASAFDFSYYMNNQGLISVDIVNINLGTNDVARITDGIYNETDVIQRYNQIINSIHSYDPNIIICLGLTENTCKVSQHNYGTACQRFNDNILNHVKALIESFGNKENERIFLTPLYLNMDLYEDYNFSDVPMSARDNTKTRRMPTDRVHQNAVGYKKNADTMYATIQYALSL